jgi:acetyl-CoA acyltransferase 2
MSRLAKDVFIVAAKRTPFGAFGGKLANLNATELGGLASIAAIQQLPKGVCVDSTIYGNVLQTSADAAFLARHVGLRAGKLLFFVAEI